MTYKDLIDSGGLTPASLENRAAFTRNPSSHIRILAIVAAPSLCGQKGEGAPCQGRQNLLHLSSQPGTQDRSWALR
jgi:hypothetical protein